MDTLSCGTYPDCDFPVSLNHSRCERIEDMRKEPATERKGGME